MKGAMLAIRDLFFALPEMMMFSYGMMIRAAGEAVIGLIAINIKGWTMFFSWLIEAHTMAFINIARIAQGKGPLKMVGLNADAMKKSFKKLGAELAAELTTGAIAFDAGFRGKKFTDIFGFSQDTQDAFNRAKAGAIELDRMRKRRDGADDDDMRRKRLLIQRVELPKGIFGLDQLNAKMQEAFLKTLDPAMEQVGLLREGNAIAGKAVEGINRLIQEQKIKSVPKAATN